MAGAGGDVEYSIALGEKALGLMKAYRTSARPADYETWFTYAAGSIGALSKAIDSCIRRNGTITDHDLHQIYEQHVSPLRFFERMERIETGLGEEVDQVAAMLDAALQTSSNLDSVLNEAASRLSAVPERRTEQLNLIRCLLQSVQAAEAAHRQLHKVFAASQEKLAALQPNLAALRAEALTDPLTTLANRKAFDACLDKVVACGAAAAEPFSLLLIDIDHFKAFNDTYGHLTGDQVLRLVALAVRQNVKGGDLAARYGGEEFAVILPNTVLRGARTVAEQIRRAVMSKDLVKRSTGEKLGRVTVSIGVATCSNNDTASTLIERADTCLYAAKRAGRNRVIDQTEQCMPIETVA